MKSVLLITLIFIAALSCKTSPTEISNTKEKELVKNDTIRIANEELEYEIIIIENGFNTWLASNARPRGFYSLPYLENKNYFFVTEWNIRALQPQRYNPNLYEMRIDYDSTIHYGYEVNYLLYNYFIYFQRKYNQKL
jgi:hypothetical protein